jgi:hypothetical protein
MEERKKAHITRKGASKRFRKKGAKGRAYAMEIRPVSWI